MNNKKTELLETFNNRFACKEFDSSKKISDEDFDFILETGRLSPSSFGFEPWKFVVVQNMELREKLKEVAWGAQTHLPTASHFVLLMSRKAVGTKGKSEYIKHIAENVQHLPSEIVDMKIDFYEKFQQNDFDLTDDRKLFDWATKQTYLPFANMMTSAAHIGIDSCPIEGFNQDAVAALLKAEGVVDTAEFGLAAMVAFGYRSKTIELFPKTRQAIEDVVTWIR